MISALFRILAAIYAVLCLFALFLIPASANGWFGIAPDPLGGVFAIVLALPWSLGLGLIGDAGAVVTALALIVMMLVNAAILFGIARLLKKER